MSRSYRTVRRVIYCLIVVILMLSGLPVMARQPPIGHLIPIGGGYSDIYAGFAQAAVANARNNQINLRNAARDLGTNNGFVIANGLLDVFVPGDAVAPSSADIRAVPTRAPTPALPTHMPAPVPTSTATPTPTLTPLATSTATAASIPTAASLGTSATGEVLPIMPITIGAALLLFVIVLVAGRRRK